MSDVLAPKQSPIRRLFITAMFNGFIALVVFVVGPYYVVIPRLYDQQQRIERLEGELRAHPAEEDEQSPTAAMPDEAPAGEGEPAGDVAPTEAAVAAP